MEHDGEDLLLDGDAAVVVGEGEGDLLRIDRLPPALPEVVPLLLQSAHCTVER